MSQFQQHDYLALTTTWNAAAPTSSSVLTKLTAAAVPTTTSVILTQLANLYLVFAINEALVLRATFDRKVWSAFLLGLLIADFGHLWSVHLVGWEVYWRFWEWNIMYWGESLPLLRFVWSRLVLSVCGLLMTLGVVGNLGFVYVGATMRICFLLGVGINSTQTKGGRRRK